MSLDGIEALMGVVVPAQDQAIARVPPAPLDERAAALQAARRERRRVGRRRHGYGALGAVMAAGAAALILAARPRSSSSLEFDVGARHVPGVVGARVEATPSQPVGLHFSDGTELVLTASALGRVLSVDARGARVSVERGTIQAAVVHRPASSWFVAVGPFDVHVKGTRFEASWDARREVFDLTMHEGIVTVTGRCLPAPLTSRAGERVELPCPASGRPGPAEPPGSAASSLDPANPPQPVAPSAGVAPTLVTRGPARELDAPARRWRSRLAERDVQRALHAIEGEGALANDWTNAPEAELLQLGDAARARGQRASAVQIYEALRRRFPDSDAAATAAFHLGQVAFDQGGSLAEARAAFATYLAERPGGSLAQEALGRLLELAARERRPEADALARQYLARAPRGPHAALARSLVRP